MSPLVSVDSDRSALSESDSPQIEAADGQWGTGMRFDISARVQSMEKQGEYEMISAFWPANRWFRNPATKISPVHFNVQLIWKRRDQQAWNPRAQRFAVDIPRVMRGMTLKLSG
jgi:hypothetical protein